MTNSKLLSLSFLLLVYCIFKINFMCVGILSAHSSVHQVSAWCPRKSKQGIGSPRMWCWGPNLGAVPEQSALLLLSHLYSPPQIIFIWQESKSQFRFYCQLGTYFLLTFPSSSRAPGPTVFHFFLWSILSLRLLSS